LYEISHFKKRLKPESAVKANTKSDAKLSNIMPQCGRMKMVSAVTYLQV